MKSVFEKGLKRVYISGPITGHENGNKNAFNEAELKFKSMNFDVVNPHNLHDRIWEEDWYQKYINKEISNNEYWAGFMKKDIEHLVQCDFIALLPNWEGSRGANMEIAIAKGLGMPIVNAIDMQEITTNINFSINKSNK